MSHSLQLSNDLHDRLQETLGQLVADKVASRIFARDATLWGPDARDEASKRLGWVDLHARRSTIGHQIEPLLRQVSDQQFDRVLLCGMGGSSLAPEVISKAAGVNVQVLDSSHPRMVDAAMSDLSSTLVMVASKSGGTVETDSQLQLALARCEAQGLPISRHIVAITDPHSPLDVFAGDAGMRVVRADPEVGGRYSALSAFGLAPTGAAGADVDQLLNEAASCAPDFAADSTDNPALILGALLSVSERAGVNVVALNDELVPGLADWIEQLLAESTGKSGRGILPVAVLGGTYPALRNVLSITLGATSKPEGPRGVHVDFPLGAQFLLWETATAVAGRVIGINPFDQPDVESSKAATRRLLDSTGPAAGSDEKPILEVSTCTDKQLLDAFSAVTAELGEDSYLSMQFYLDRWRVSGTKNLASELAAKLMRPVTLGWGPRFLHSTGQLHKGGPKTGVFLQVISDAQPDIAVPNRNFTFGELISSQAAGDAEVLREIGRPVFTWRVNDEVPDIERLCRVIWS